MLNLYSVLTHSQLKQTKNFWHPALPIITTRLVSYKISLLPSPKHTANHSTIRGFNLVYKLLMKRQTWAEVSRLTNNKGLRLSIKDELYRASFSAGLIVLNGVRRQ